MALLPAKTNQAPIGEIYEVATTNNSVVRFQLTEDGASSSGGPAVGWVGSSGAGYDADGVPIIVLTNGGPGGVFRPATLTFEAVEGDVLELRAFTPWNLESDIDFAIEVVATDDDFDNIQVVPNTRLEYSTLAAASGTRLFLTHVAWFTVPSDGTWKLALQLTASSDPPGSASLQFAGPDALQMTGNNWGPVTPDEGP